jgi:hypothetical protein
MLLPLPPLLRQQRRRVMSIMAVLLLPLIRQRRRVMGLRWGRPQGLVVVLLLVLLVLLLLLVVVVVVVVVLERQLAEVAHIVGLGVAKMLLVGMEAEHLLQLLLERLLLHVHLVPSTDISPVGGTLPSQ